MKYAIMTATGFQMSGPEAAVYNSQEEALKHMGPGDQLVPLDEPKKSAKILKFPVIDR